MIGQDRFYRYLLFCASKQMMNIENGSYKGMSPEIMFLNCYDQFMILYRREGEEVYLDLAKIFRRAGHKIYRVMLKRKMIEKNAKFLNLVSNGE